MKRIKLTRLAQDIGWKPTFVKHGSRTFHRCSYCFKMLEDGEIYLLKTQALGLSRSFTWCCLPCALNRDEPWIEIIEEKPPLEI